MTSLDWQSAVDGVGSGRYRIRRVADRSRHPWRLDIVDVAEQAGRRGALAPTFHRTLGGAKAAALRAERERRERELLVGHTVVAVAASLVFAGLITLPGSVITFAAALTALYVGVRSFTSLVAVKTGEAWWWARDDGAPVLPSAADRIVSAGMHWVGERFRAVMDAEPPASVQVLPPEPPD
jgi:hypothetical protein